MALWLHSYGLVGGTPPLGYEPQCSGLAAGPAIAPGSTTKPSVPLQMRPFTDGRRTFMAISRHLCSSLQLCSAHMVLRSQHLGVGGCHQLSGDFMTQIRKQGLDTQLPKGTQVGRTSRPAPDSASFLLLVDSGTHTHVLS
jgi:hypothetical protein